MACPVLAVNQAPPPSTSTPRHTPTGSWPRPPAHQAVAQVVHEMINTVGAAVNDVQSSLVLELLVSSPTQQQ